MPLVLAGLSFKTAPLDARERLAAAPEAEVRRKLKEAEWEGALALSTCNRYEILLSDADREGAEMKEWLSEFLSAAAGMPVAPFLYLHEEGDAVEHLFRVASGLDSLVPGESEILGQVKAAYEASRAAGLASKTLNVLLQRAFFVGKWVRTHTQITSGQTSVASVSVALAERIFGDLAKSRVLILGAGKMAELSAKHLLGSRVEKLYIANRTPSKAQELAARFSGEAVAFDRIPELLGEVDIVLSSTGSDKPVVTKDMVRAAKPHRRGRSLFFIDIAMPRDVEEGVHALENAYVYTLDDLRAIVEENLQKRRGEFDAAAALVRERAAEFQRWLEAARQGKDAPLRHTPSRSAEAA